MIFAVQRYWADTCGNRWVEDEPVYTRAVNEQAVRNVLNTRPKFLGGYYITPVQVLPLAGLLQALERQLEE